MWRHMCGASQDLSEMFAGWKSVWGVLERKMLTWAGLDMVSTECPTSPWKKTTPFLGVTSENSLNCSFPRIPVTFAFLGCVTGSTATSHPRQSTWNAVPALLDCSEGFAGRWGGKGALWVKTNIRTMKARKWLSRRLISQPHCYLGFFTEYSELEETKLSLQQRKIEESVSRSLSPLFRAFLVAVEYKWSCKNHI